MIEDPCDLRCPNCRKCLDKVTDFKEKFYSRKLQRFLPRCPYCGLPLEIEILE